MSGSSEWFPCGFLWGVATAAYQIEGSVSADGKGEGIWDRFCRVPGAIRDGTTGDVACDHYRRWEHDLDLLSELGCNAYRFSLSWPRIMPEGCGRINQAGMDFYCRLVDELCERGIAPVVTLWHGDHPQALEDLGGWGNRDMVEWFADLAEVAFAHLGDRVEHWITLNEPNCFLYQGLDTGNIAPGKRNRKLCFQAIHHALLGHGKAVARFRSSGKVGSIGMCMSVDLWSPATDDPADHVAALRAETENNWWFLDPLYFGHYPEEFFESLGELAPHATSSDFEIISTPCDFLAVNYYGRNRVRKDRKALGNAAKGDFAQIGLEVDPDGMAEVLEEITQRYGPQVFIIAENGVSANDLPPINGMSEDPTRIVFLKDHIAVLDKALASGIDIRGYFVWTLMDNFEWSQGLSARFGLYYVDHATQIRTPKRSALWYRDFIQSVHLLESK